MKTEVTVMPKLYTGLDIHKKSWSVHFRTDLFDHRGFTMPPELEKLQLPVEVAECHLPQIGACV